jgi:hypothetical protein
MQHIVREVDQRDQEEKATNVIFKNIEVTQQRIENFKSKRIPKGTTSRASHTGLILTQPVVLF